MQVLLSDCPDSMSVGDACMEAKCEGLMCGCCVLYEVDDKCTIGELKIKLLNELVGRD
jgi:hypothetical protein